MGMSTGKHRQNSREMLPAGQHRDQGTSPSRSRRDNLVCPTPGLIVLLPAPLPARSPRRKMKPDSLDKAQPNTGEGAERNRGL